jgi:CDP-glycerol glycerophosphotransferase
LSVVVPFHNVAEYLDACLTSLAAQTSAADTEVIMVDDGSTDDSARIAQSWADREERFSLIRQAQAGPGAARNTGVDQARGEYLAFVDGDDMVPPDAYELLLRTLARTGSDLVSGAVNRIGTFGTRPSPWQVSHTVGRMTWPNGVRWTARSCPAPWQRGHVSIGVPGSAPFPRQCSHTATTS